MTTNLADMISINLGEKIYDERPYEDKPYLSICGENPSLMLVSNF